MMVNFPDEAAATICFSMELLIFADRFCMGDLAGI
jgi:hypothetical protein